MNKLVAAVVFVAVSGGMYMLCANAHIDIFPCERAERSMGAPGSLIEPPLRKSDGTCSLLAHDRGTNPGGEYQRLNPAGWALLAAFCGGIGLLAGGLIGFLTRKKS